VREYDENKIVATTWNDASVYCINRNDAASMKKPIIIPDPDKKNNHPTDLWPLPSYDPQSLPFFVKRGMNAVSLVDVRNHIQYVLYEDKNTKWGYNKLSVVDRQHGRFDLVYVSNEGGHNNLIKRYSFPAVFEEGLRRVINLRHKEQLPQNFIQRILKIKQYK
jgi:hypothetical protein